MSVIAPITQDMTFDQWRVQDNLAITALNNEGINTVVQIVNPLNDEDILVYNAADGFFENAGITTLVTQIIQNLATIPTDNLLPYYYAASKTVF